MLQADDISPTIRALTPQDAEACDAIIRTLPYHFGDPGGREECSRAVRRDPGLVAVVAGEVIGFLTVVRHFPASAEITWMAVRMDQRRRGLGGRLIERLCADLRADGCRLLLVMTLSALYDEGETPDGYEYTRAFYRSNGFYDARDLPDYWPSNPALLLVRPLDAADRHAT
jgi:ribosomal protein S18 acetylase RimI-like enzyme